MELTARLTADATIFNTKNNKQVVHFTVALNHRFKSGGQAKTQTDYYRCSYWLSTAVTSFLKQGVLVNLSGRVTASAYLTSEGSPKAQLNINVDKITPLTSSKNAAIEKPRQANPAAPTEREEMPF